MPISKQDVQWKEYENKDMFYRGIVLELLMNNSELAYTIEEIRAEIANKIGPDAANKDLHFEGNVRAALMDSRISFNILNGINYYSLKDKPLKR